MLLICIAKKKRYVGLDMFKMLKGRIMVHSFHSNSDVKSFGSHAKLKKP